MFERCVVYVLVVEVVELGSRLGIVRSNLFAGIYEVGRRGLFVDVPTILLSL